MAPEIDLPDVVDEVRAVFTRYEEALASDDRAALDDAFWNDARVVRYGIAECQYGIAAIRAWRRDAAPVPPRALRNTTITTVGRDVAVVSTEFDDTDGTVVGRQTQTWVRLTEGWRIVAAHVSTLPTRAG